MRVLAVNAGSSSLKLSVVEAGRRVARAEISDWDGADLSGVEELLDGQAEVDAVAHRVVHGGADLSGPVRIDAGVLARIEGAATFAPLHNPPALRAIRRTGEEFPELPAVACFDTTFHAGLPAASATYAVPADWTSRWGLRRYGAHGLSHAYVARRAPHLVDGDPGDLRLVSCHLGSGASLAAILNGRCVDTTMGLTPLEGLVMATRSGSVDPGLVLWLLQSGHLELGELAHELEHGSGLLGLSGTPDLRDVLARRADGDPAAGLAYDVYLHSLVRFIAAMTAATRGLDVLAFTGGVGEHQAVLRADVAQALGYLGVSVDSARNSEAVEGSIGQEGGSVAVLVIPAGEDLEMARETEDVLGPG